MVRNTSSERKKETESERERKRERVYKGPPIYYHLHNGHRSDRYDIIYSLITWSTIRHEGKTRGKFKEGEGLVDARCTLTTTSVVKSRVLIEGTSSNGASQRKKQI